MLDPYIDSNGDKLEPHTTEQKLRFIDWIEDGHSHTIFHQTNEEDSKVLDGIIDHFGLAGSWLWQEEVYDTKGLGWSRHPDHPTGKVLSTFELMNSINHALGGEPLEAYGRGGIWRHNIEEARRILREQPNLL